MGGLFGGKGYNLPPVPPPVPPPTPSDAEVEEAKRKERLVQRKRKGRAATILTGQQGISGEAPVSRKTLLGE
jgi:hypothetical protein